MESKLQDIYRDIVDAEKKHLDSLPISEQDRFQQLARDTFKFGVGRAWGDTWFHGHLEEIDFKENGALLKFSKDDYCRSCYMGIINDETFLPDWLIRAIDDGDERAALGRFMKERVDRVRAFEAEQNAKKATEIERKRKAQEERDAAEFERLKKKFEGR